MKSRAAIKDVARVLRIPPGEADRIAKLIPSGRPTASPSRRRSKKVDEMQDLVRGNPALPAARLRSLALEGLSRHMSVHAAGVVIAPGPLDEYVPVCTAPTKGAGAAADGEDVDRHAVRHGCAREGRHAQDGLPRPHDAHGHPRRRARRSPRAPARGSTSTRSTFDDPRGVRSCCARAAPPACSSSSRRSPPTCCARMRCDRFDDLVASNALMRPGPLDAGMHTRLHQRGSAARSR